MIFSKKYKLLKKLQEYQALQNSPVVKGIVLEEALNINYKTLHEIATYWEKRGCIISRSQRGGNLEYQITSLGNLACNKYLKTENKVKFIIIIIIFIFVLYQFI